MIEPQLLASAIKTAYTLLPSSMGTPEATQLLYAIGWQESRFDTRTQIDGPARGFWQFEQGGGVVGVLSHEKTTAHILRVLEALCYPSKAPYLCHAALQHNDVLAACFARLLLYADPSPLPGLASESDGWNVYKSIWRPGRPRFDSWSDAWAFATAARLAAK